MIDSPPLLAAFTVGLLGGAHCIGMCGGVIGALTMAVDANKQSKRFYLISAYNAGRIFSYVVIAVVFFFFVDLAAGYFSLSIMRVIAGCLLIAMGLYLADWWRGLVYLEKGGALLWRYIQPLSKPLLPVTRVWQALLLGMIWGWLPCGLIYSALAYSATAGNASEAALIMLCFGLGTLPAVLASGLAAEKLLQIIRQKKVRVLMALLLIAFGLWTLVYAFGHAHHKNLPKANQGDHIDHSHHHHQ